MLQNLSIRFTVTLLSANSPTAKRARLSKAYQPSTSSDSDATLCQALRPYLTHNSPDINPVDYYVWGVMLAAYQKHKSKPTRKSLLRDVMQEIWDNLSQDCINKAVLGVRKRL